MREMVERIYTPASIIDAYKKLPAKGRIIKIAYYREYKGDSDGERNASKVKRTRRARIVDKHPKGTHFTVEFIPDEPPPGMSPEQQRRFNKRGQYRQTFQTVDLITEHATILGVK